MPPSSCRASSSRNSHSSRILRNALTAAGLSRRITFLSDKSAGLSQRTPPPSELTVAKQTTKHSSNYGEYYIHYWKKARPVFYRANRTSREAGTANKFDPVVPCPVAKARSEIRLW